MRKNIFIIFFTLSFVLLSSSPLQAITTEEGSENTTTVGITNDENMVINPPNVYPPQFTPGVYLLSLFDKKGMAKIAAKIIFDPEDKDILKDFSFTIPGEVTLLRVVHEKMDLKDECNTNYLQPLPLQDSPSSNFNPKGCPQYFVSKFTTIIPQTEKTAAGLKVTLATDTNSKYQTQQNILLLYQTDSYIKKGLVNFYYKLPTPLIPFSLVSAQMGIMTKDNLRLRGTTMVDNNYGYQPNFRALEKARNLQNEENQDLTTFTNDIVYQGFIRRSESDLNNNNSFEVTGVYGKVWILLYFREIALYIFIFLIFALCVILLIKFLLKKYPHVRLIVLTIFIAFITTLMLLGILVGIFILWRNQIVFSQLPPVKYNLVRS